MNLGFPSIFVSLFSKVFSLVFSSSESISSSVSASFRSLVWVSFEEKYFDHQSKATSSDPSSSSSSPLPSSWTDCFLKMTYYYTAKKASLATSLNWTIGDFWIFYNPQFPVWDFGLTSWAFPEIFTYTAELVFLSGYPIPGKKSRSQAKNSRDIP